ncbi:MAG TPA: glycerate kinase, partial [Chthoniobacterales bacterium]|nr:glycerate kinase [Chthoniobacterales bacterium]
ARLAEVAAQTFGSDYRDVAGAGAAGGLGFGLMTFCGASIRSGFEVVAGAVDLQRKVEAADIVITGEGKLDRQTLSGKAPAGLAELARTCGKPVYAIVGQVAADLDAQQLFAEVVALEDHSENFRDTPTLLETRARELALRFSKSGSR